MGRARGGDRRRRGVGAQGSPARRSTPAEASWHLAAAPKARRARASLRCAALVVLAIVVAPGGRARVDAGHARLSRRSGDALARAAAAGDRRAAARIPVRLSVRVDRRRHEHREEVRAGRAPLPFVERRDGDLRRRATTSRCAPSALGYLAHLAADSVAHNYFVPKQLAVTSSTSALGHSYWESRFETHLGTECARRARELILHRSLAVRRPARPRAEPDDLQHVDQSADLPRHGDRRRQRVVAADLSADDREQPLGSAGRATSAATSRDRTTSSWICCAHGSRGAVQARSVGRRGAAAGEAGSATGAARRRRRIGCTKKRTSISECRRRRCTFARDLAQPLYAPARAASN